MHPSSQSHYAGAIKGDFSVDSNGSAVYSIDIQTPPGTNGMQPALSFVYSSLISNGMLGAGWNLRGLSSVMRVPKTPAQDGVKIRDSVHYDNRDRFVLDGVRLVAVEGEYGAAASVYHTEIETWKKVVAIPGSAGFVSQTREGVRYEYGIAPDAQIRSGGEGTPIRTWALSRVVDACGNFMTVKYRNDPATTAFYPASISYTGNKTSGASLEPGRTVEFVYEPQKYIQPRYESGCPVHETLRLKQVKTAVDGQSVFVYSLDYEEGAASGRSRLRQITLADANGRALPPTRFDWLDIPQAVFAPTKALIDPQSAVGSDVIPLDVDGSGRRDLLSATQDDNGQLLIKLMISAEGGGKYLAPVTQAFRELTYHPGCLFPLDLNGDGKTEIVHQESDNGNLSLTLLKARKDNGSWRIEQNPRGAAGPKNLPYGGRLISMDVNGDGLVDLVYCWGDDNHQLHVQVLLSDGTGFKPGEATDTDLEYSPDGQLIATDFNGDGMTDLLYAFPEDRDGGLYLGLRVLLSNGRKLNLLPASPLASNVTLPFGGALIAARLKDDDQDDLVYATSDDNGKLQVRALLGTGIDYRLPSAAPLKTNIGFTGWIFPMAMRGAGLMELAVASRDDNGMLDLRMLRWNGVNFGAPELCAPAAGQLQAGGNIIPADVYGNGKTDLLYFAPRDNQSLEMLLFPAPSTVPDRLFRITDGLGSQFEISYKPLTDPTVYSKEDAPAGTSLGGLLEGQGLLNSSIGGSAWAMSPGQTLTAGTSGSSYSLQSRQFAEYVVASYVVGDGRGSSHRYDYSYRGCRIDPRGRGWLGFSSREVKDADSGTTAIEHYNQIFPATSTVSGATLRRTSDGALIVRQQCSYGVTGRQGAYMDPGRVDWKGDNRWPGVYRSEVVKTRSEMFTMGKNVADVTETQANTYDVFGNIIFTANETTNGAPLYTTCEYSNLESEWRLGDLKRRVLSADAAGTKVFSREEADYEPKSGKTIESRTWDDVNHRWLATIRRFDPWGNEVSSTEPSGAITTTEYDVRHRSFAIKRGLPANDSGVVLSSSAEFDPAFGVEVSQTDVNGAVRRQKLDGLGRIVETLGPDPDGRLVPLTQTSWGVDAHGYYSETRHATDWSGSVWKSARVYHDGLGRQYRKLIAGVDGNRGVVTERVFNAAGKIVRESLPHFEGDTALWIETRYDEAGRIVRIEEPADGGGTRVTENGYPHVDRETSTEMPGRPEARTTACEYASYAGKRSLIKSIDATGAVSQYEYDAARRIVRATDPAGVTTTSRYDTVGRRVEMKVANTQTTFAGETVFHDDKARTTLVRTVKGNTICLERDARERLRKRTVTTASGESSDTTYEYDGSAVRGLDRLVRVNMPGGMNYSYEYDAHGNPITQHITLAKEIYQIRRAYTPTGAVDRMIYPDGSTARNKYNKAGHLEEVLLTEPGGPERKIAQFASFTAFGRPREITYGNGLREARGYNAIGQLKSQSLAQTGADPLSQTDFDWSPFHSLSRISDRVDGKRTQAFSYDAAGRLTKSVRNADAAPDQHILQSFSYDKGGNLTSKNGVEFSYEGHQVVKGIRGNTPVFTANYDADGVMLHAARGAGDDDYLYDGLGQMIASKDAKYQYDHTGQRIVKESKESTTFYVCRDFEVTVFPNSGSQSTKYVPGPEGAVAQITRVLKSAAGSLEQSENMFETRDPKSGSLAGVPILGVSYFHTNLINSTSVHTGETGALIAMVEYEPFGEIRTITGSDAFRPKFTGKELDRETGLYYFNARYYDPGIGRFTSADDRLGGSFGAPDSLNRYAYVLNNPITGIDFDGHFRWDILADVLIGIAAVTLVVAATVLTGGAAAVVGLAGSTLLGAAVSGSFYSAKTSDSAFSWSEWGIEVGVGAATGFISGIPSGGAVALGAKAYSSVVAAGAKQFVFKGGSVVLQASVMRQLAARSLQLAVSAIGGAIGGGLSGLAGNAFRNMAAGRDSMEGWDSAVTKGAWQGAITGSMAGAASTWAKPWFKAVVDGRNIGAGWIVVAGASTANLVAFSGLLVWAHMPSSYGSSRDSGQQGPQSMQFTSRGLAPA